MTRLISTLKVETSLAIVFILAGCNSSFHDLGPPKQLTKVEYEIPMHDILIPNEPEVIQAVSRVSMEDNSLWDNTQSIFFRDTRAFEVGDILTVDISINDSAKLDNSSESQTEIDGGIGASTDLTLGNLGTLAPIGINGSLAGNVEFERGGSVDRNEQIDLRVAAVITDSASNGNLRIRGSQEVRVNHEVRILTVEGVVRTKDITPENTIPYEKIAEARITYGGHNSRRKSNLPKLRNLFSRKAATIY